MVLRQINQGCFLTGCLCVILSSCAGEPPPTRSEIKNQNTANVNGENVSGENGKDGYSPLVKGVTESPDDPRKKQDKNIFGTWTALNGIVAAADSTVIPTEKYILTFGGESRNKYGCEISAAVHHRYDISTGEVKSMSTTGFTLPRSEALTAWTGDRLLVWGGRQTYASGSNCSNQDLNDGGMYLVDRDEWITISPPASAISTHIHTFVEGNWLFLDLVKSELLAFEPNANSWKKTTVPIGPNLSSYPKPLWAWTGVEFFVWGGATKDAQPILKNDAWLYNPKTNTWRLSKSSTKPAVRLGGKAMATKDRVILFGGTDEKAVALTDQLLWTFDPAADTWTKVVNVHIADLQRPLISATAIGSDLVFWGGFTKGVYTPNGLIYKPATDSWTPLPANGNIANRAHFIAFDYGGKLAVIEGASDGNIVKNIGAVLTPSANKP
jgi:hypothetical protein